MNNVENTINTQTQLLNFIKQFISSVLKVSEGITILNLLEFINSIEFNQG